MRAEEIYLNHFLGQVHNKDERTLFREAVQELSPDHIQELRSKIRQCLLQGFRDRQEGPTIH